MNIATQKNPDGKWQALDENVFDGAPDSEWPANCIGYGDTRQEAIDDLCEALELPYSMKPEQAA